MPITLDRAAETGVLSKRKRSVDDHIEDVSDMEDFLVNSLRGDQGSLSRRERMAVEESEDVASVAADTVGRRRRAEVADVQDVDSDVQDVLTDTHDSHWLWGSVKRIRRSLDQLMGSDSPPAAVAQKSDEPKKVRKLKKTGNTNKLHKGKKHGKRAKHSEGQKLNRSHKNELKNRPLIGRPKRQQDDDYNDTEGDDEDEIGSGDNVGERLCTYYM